MYFCPKNSLAPVWTVPTMNNSAKSYSCTSQSSHIIVDLNKRNGMFIGVRHNGRPFPIVVTASAQETEKRECTHETSATPARGISSSDLTQCRFFLPQMTFQTP